MIATAHVAENRTIFTYELDGQARGVATGYRDGDTFVVEHVTVFPGAPAAMLLGMVRAGIDEAFARGIQTLIFYVPEDGYEGLALLGRRVGFTEYACERGFRWFVKWLIS